MTSKKIAGTYGALLIGAFFGMTLSGVVAAQVIVYLKTYKSDRKLLKVLVLYIWFFDLLHSAFICASVWYYVIQHFGDVSKIDHIPWTLPTTVVFTAMVTFAVHCFFIYRIFKLSKRNFYITVPMAILAVLRVGSASTTTAEMMRLGSFRLFLQQFRWVFTLGLSLSTTIDLLITASLFYYLGINRAVSTVLDAVIDSLLLYALENGALTCAATILSTICWLTMPHNLIFMGTHFVIGKLYANSLLLALNTREQIRQKSVSQEPRKLSMGKHAGFHQNLSVSTSGRSGSTSERGDFVDVPPVHQLKVNVNVTRSTQYGWDSPTEFVGNNTKLPDLVQDTSFDLEKQVTDIVGKSPNSRPSSGGFGSGSSECLDDGKGIAR